MKHRRLYKNIYRAVELFLLIALVAVIIFAL